MQPNSWDVTCNDCVRGLHNGDHPDVHLVCPSAILLSEHFPHHLHISNPPIHDQCLAPPESTF